jgi:hypothetical protein
MGINRSRWRVLLVLGVLCLLVLGASGTMLFYDMTDGYGCQSTQERVGFLWWFYIQGGRAAVANEVYGNSYTTLTYDYLNGTPQTQIVVGDCVPCKKAIWKAVAYALYKQFLEGSAG